MVEHQPLMEVLKTLWHFAQKTLRLTEDNYGRIYFISTFRLL
jgi:hypothetical protein